jgi:hypothetical protein
LNAYAHGLSHATSEKSMNTPAVSSTGNAVNFPSVGQMLRAIPKVMVGLGAVLNGISNPSSAAPRSPMRHGGGLQTEAHAHWASHIEPAIQACLNEPWVHRFRPDRASTECMLRTAAHREQIDPDLYPYEVTGRGLAYWFEEFVPGPGPDVPQQAGEPLINVMHEARDIMRATDEYIRTAEQLTSLVWFHSSAASSELEDPTQHYSAERLTKVLEDGVGLDSFKEEAVAQSFRLNEMLKSAGDQIFRLKPEIMGSKDTREAFKQRVDRDFVNENWVMSERQCDVVLAVTAADMNKQNSRRVT